MWKLTVERKYTSEFEGNEYENTAEMFFTAESLYELEEIIKDFTKYCIDDCKYIIEHIRKKGEENA